MLCWKRQINKKENHGARPHRRSVANFTLARIFAERSKRRSLVRFRRAAKRDKKTSVLPYDEVDADDADRLLRLAAVQKGSLGQHPDEAAALREEAVAADFALTLGKY
jgi:hypothetical protein